MNISKDESSSSSVSPTEHSEENAIDFPVTSDPHAFFMPTVSQSTNYNYSYGQEYYHGGHHHFIPDPTEDTPLLLFEDNLSSPPSSTRSPGSIHNFGFNQPFYFNTSKDYSMYTSHPFLSEEGPPTDTEKKASRPPPSCAQDNHSKDTETSNKKQTKDGGKKSTFHKRQVREKGKKRCSNCYSNNSPSWRRSISNKSKGDLLCNACGLYEKTAKKKRMLITHEDGNTKVVRKRDARDYVCAVCGVRNISRWRRVHDVIKCERCSRRRTAKL